MKIEKFVPRACPHCHVALVSCLCWCMALPPREAAILPDMPHIHPAEAPAPLPPQVVIVATTSIITSTGALAVGPLTITLS